ncbi:phage tail sheath subtilisin-like domain-containing protein [Actinocrispum sp. NPDC049592]|uniref:phage tail sheath subtilisin-like domain-containing protein n=1 Tax=Actinocrispum sp. NPDC049592 TaxID=3154835 RepID=UPI003432C9CC
MPDYRAPGVYIEELQATGPISGVGTSTAAFIGPALRGAIGQPIKVTSWTQFTGTFGAYISGPRRYLAHAVRGFFDNGGTVAYITRVGTARPASLRLTDRAAPAGTALVVTAREEGPSGHNVAVAVREATVVTGAKILVASAANASGEGNTVTMQKPEDAALFLVDDIVDVGGQRVQVARVRGKELTLTTSLPAKIPAATVRLADTVADQRRLRVAGSGIERGSVLLLKQGAVSEFVSVETVSGDVLTLASGLTKTYTLKPEDPAVEVSSVEFSLDVTGPGSVERFDNLSIDPRHSRYFERLVDSALVEVSLPEEPNLAAPPGNLPKKADAAKLAGGVADDLTQLGASDYDAALARLAKVDDVSLVCAPDAAAAPAIQQLVLAHCEKLQDRFAIFDCAENADPLDAGPTGVLAHRAALGSDRGYAALYYPWIQIADPAGEGTLMVPPSGHVAGVFARSDAVRGVHKAPANEPITGALGLRRLLDDVEQGELNIEGVNVLRVFGGGGRPVVWGARTTAPAHETAWRYVSVRRLFLFIEESIQEGLRWAVFEPNDLSLRKRLERTVTEFLSRVWGSGALFGASTAEAFYVKIDNENNPPAIRELGQIVVEIGVAPVRPAEFIVVRIGMTQGGSQVREG